jgi:hypothetical protein
MQTDHAAADHRYLAGKDAGYTAEQDAEAAIGLLQRRGTGLDRQPAGNFRHRRQKRQPATIVGHRLIGNGGHA